MRFEQAFKAMREGKKAQKGCCTYRLDVSEDGRYSLVMEYPIGNLSVDDLISEKLEVVQDDAL